MSTFLFEHLYTHTYISIHTHMTQDQYLASRLLEYLMEHAHHDNRSVFRNNLEIIKTLMESWRDKLQAPTKLVGGELLTTCP